MKIRYILTLGLVFISACTSFTFRADEAPSPIDPTIDQTRIEFIGCNVADTIGTIACLPGDTLQVVTEFAGDLIYFSSGDTCSIREQIRATPPLTSIQLTPQTSICPIVVYYLPDYPSESDSIYTIKGIYGEISLQPDKSYTPDGNFAIAVNQTLTLTFPNAVRGSFVSRQTKENVVNFTGTTLTFQPLTLGTDLIQVKIWLADGTNQYFVIPGNYYSPYELDLLFDQTTNQKNLVLTFPTSVTAVTVNGVVSNKLVQNLALDFTGNVRAYTVQGRTRSAYFEKGVLQWSQ
jgi:hypothetical protein